MTTQPAPAAPGPRRLGLTGSVPVSDLLDAYLAEQEVRVRPDHAQNTSRTLRALLTALRAETVQDITPTVVMAHRRKRLQSVSRRTANLELGALRTMLDWCVSVDIIDRNPIARVLDLPVRDEDVTHARGALTAAQVGRVTLVFRDQDEHPAQYGGFWAAHDVRDRIPQTPLLLALLWTGARWSELVRAEWCDIDGDTLRLRKTKNGKARAVPLPAALLEELAKLPHREGRIFLSPTGRPWGKSHNFRKRLLYPALKRAGIARVNERGEHIDVHALRHTFATRLAEGGVPLSQTQAILGHRDPKLTARVYTHLTLKTLGESVAKALFGGAQERAFEGCNPRPPEPQSGALTKLSYTHRPETEGVSAPQEGPSSPVPSCCQWFSGCGAPRVDGHLLCPQHEHALYSLSALEAPLLEEPWAAEALVPFLSEEALVAAGGAS